MAKTWLPLVICLLLSVSTVHAQLQNPVVNQPKANGVNLIYDPGSGLVDLVVGDDFNALTAFRIQSENSLLVGEAPPDLDGLFDIYRADVAFKLDVNAYRDVKPFLQVTPGTSPSVMHQDFTAIGAADIGGDVAEAVYLVVPEPTSLATALAAIPLLGLVRRRRRR